MVKKAKRFLAIFLALTLFAVSLSVSSLSASALNYGEKTLPDNDKFVSEAANPYLKHSQTEDGLFVQLGESGHSADYGSSRFGYNQSFKLDKLHIRLENISRTTFGDNYLALLVCNSPKGVPGVTTGGLFKFLEIKASGDGKCCARKPDTSPEFSYSYSGTLDIYVYQDSGKWYYEVNGGRAEFTPAGTLNKDAVYVCLSNWNPSVTSFTITEAENYTSRYNEVLDASKIYSDSASKYRTATQISSGIRIDLGKTDHAIGYGDSRFSYNQAFKLNKLHIKLDNINCESGDKYLRFALCNTKSGIPGTTTPTFFRFIDIANRKAFLGNLTQDLSFSYSGTLDIYFYKEADVWYYEINGQKKSFTLPEGLNVDAVYICLSNNEAAVNSFTISYIGNYLERLSDVEAVDFTRIGSSANLVTVANVESGVKLDYSGPYAGAVAVYNKALPLDGLHIRVENNYTGTTPSGDGLFVKISNSATETPGIQGKLSYYFTYDGKIGVYGSPGSYGSLNSAEATKTLDITFYKDGDDWKCVANNFVFKVDVAELTDKDNVYVQFSSFLYSHAVVTDISNQKPNIDTTKAMKTNIYMSAVATGAGVLITHNYSGTTDFIYSPETRATNWYNQYSNMYYNEPLAKDNIQIKLNDIKYKLYKTGTNDPDATELRIKLATEVKQKSTGGNYATIGEPNSCLTAVINFADKTVTVGDTTASFAYNTDDLDIRIYNYRCAMYFEVNGTAVEFEPGEDFENAQYVYPYIQLVGERLNPSIMVNTIANYQDNIPKNTSVLGDGDLDGKLNSVDIVNLVNILLGKTAAPTGSMLRVVDITGDGTLNLKDLVRIKKILADAVTLELLKDGTFENGLTLLSKNGQSSETLSFGKADVIPAWSLAQWSTDYEMSNPELKTSEGMSYYENDGKLIGTYVDDRGDNVLRLAVNGSSEWQEGPYAYENGWAHLVAESGFKGYNAYGYANGNVGRMNSLNFSLDFNLTKAEAKAEDRNDRTAQYNLCIMVQNLNSASADYSKGFYLTIPCYDYRENYGVPSENVKLRVDKGTGSLLYIANVNNPNIYSDSNNGWNKQPTLDSGWAHLNINLVPYIANVLAAINDTSVTASNMDSDKDRFYMNDTTLDDLYITNMNIGWEVPGSYDVSADIKNVSMKAIYKFD